MSFKVQLDGRIHTNPEFLLLMETVFEALLEFKTASDLERNSQIREFLHSPQGELITKSLAYAKTSNVAMDVLTRHTRHAVGMKGTLIDSSLVVKDSGNPRPAVFLEIGPFSIEVGVDDLKRAIRPFET
jgi:hypothetical protein